MSVPEASSRELALERRTHTVAAGATLTSQNAVKWKLDFRERSFQEVGPTEGASKERSGL